MDTYRQYQLARDAAWRALLRCPEKRLPVAVEALAQAVGVQVLPFPQAEEEPRLKTLLRKAGRGAAVSLRIRGTWHIFVGNGLDDSHRRFAIAHELGHLLLGHESRALAPGVRTFASGENAGDLLEDPQDMADYAADIFAIRLLAPACLLHEMHVDSPGAIMNLCGLPPRAAQLRGERMELLNARDAFYAHPLERQVRDAYLPFLRSLMGGTKAPASAARQRLVTPLPQAKEEAQEEEKKPTPLDPLKRSRFPRWALILCALAALAGAALALWPKK